MKWLLANKEWIFSGIGVFILGILLAFFRHKKKGKILRQKQKSGSHSTNIQIGGDLKR